MGVYWDWGKAGETGRLLVPNRGTAPTFPLLRVRGALSGGFVITDVTSGRVVSLARPIPAGSVVEVDQRTGQAVLDGVADVTAFLTAFQFFAIPGGAAHEIQFSPIGSADANARLTVAIRDAEL